MRNTALSALASCGLVFSTSAQSDCTDGRYIYPPAFDSVVVTTNVLFGSNAAVSGGAPQNLLMDIYEPAGDVLEERPAVVVAFGGSFVAGSRADVAPLCQRLAQLGYVVIAPDYRVGFFFPTSNTTQLAVTRCMHDLRGCIRYLRKSVAQDENPWRIDPERIIVGGVSAGGIGAVQVAYLDQSAEIPEVLYDDTLTIGGIEGNSGSPGYSSDPLAVWSMSGAVGDTNWIQPGDEPLISLHEEFDYIVPYGTQEVSVLGIPTGLIASGSRDVHARMDHVGVPNCLTTYLGNDHVGYLNTDVENAVGRVAAFLADVVCNQPIACGNLATGIDQSFGADANALVFPNPTDGPMTVRCAMGSRILVFDASGRIRMDVTAKGTLTHLDLAVFPAGIYAIKMSGSVNTTTRVIKR